MMAIDGSRQRTQTSATAAQITFGASDLKSQCPNLKDLVVILIQMGELTVKKVLLDPGSSADVLFYSTFKKMQVNDKALQPRLGELVGFSGEKVPVSGYVWLRTTLGESPNSKTLDIQFLVVDCANPYNVILGRPSFNSFRVIISTIHVCVKFLVQDNVITTVHADLKEARQCYNAGLKVTANETITMIHYIYNSESIPTLTELDPRESNNCPAPTDDLEKVQLGNPYQITNIGSIFSAGTKQNLIETLKCNIDLFAWMPADMPEIDPNFICHKLVVNPNARPIRQKKRNLGAERKSAAIAETQKLLDAGFIREPHFSLWLANVVMIKKSSGKWRMRVDFTNLNKVCPKDSYPLLNINKLVDDISGYIKCSVSWMPILVIIRHKCTLMMKKKQHLKRTKVDDMVVKLISEQQHEADLNEVFHQLRNYNMRLNPKKCAFGVHGGKFLGFLLTNREIEANPDKCHALISMQSPRSIKEVQQLIGCLAALSRFLPAIAAKSYHFFNTLRKAKKFLWTDVCEKAFVELKNLLSSPPILKKPQQDLAGRLTKWAIELSEFDFSYESRGSPKIQALANFVSEFTNLEEPIKTWELYVDGASNESGCGAWILLKDNAGV
ncbi:uncharacterized protein LOC107460361 [Arachis duranensis]|uniref:Uncharacterized protein LOC107460361 n=1 Tax=Arachis duranensis TaxID=130453 RepID=A0A6P4B9E8_ARADU|nr:uncharacterized protein LOC107460361 [Arachis duranensis]